LPYNSVTTIVYAPDTTIWLGTVQNLGSGGLVKIKNGQLSVFSKENSLIPYNTLDRIIIDPNGNLLLSSDVLFELRNGILDGYLYLFDGKDNWVEISPAVNSKDLTNRVTATIYDKNGYLWVATGVDPNRSNADYSLSKYSNGEWNILSPKRKNFPRTYIPDIAVDNSNNLWIAAPDADGIIKIAID